MNASEVRPPLDGFEARLEAELVKVVAARAAAPQRRRSATVRRSAVRASAVAVLAAGVAASVVTAGSSGSPAAGPVHIHTAAFTVDSNTNGTIHVTWNKDRFSQDRQGLQQALRAAGLPVLIKEGVFCKGPHDKGSLDASGEGAGVNAVIQGVSEADGTVDFIFTPAALPAGDELFIGYLSPAQLAVTQGRPGSVERLVPIGVPLTCTTQPPPSTYEQQPASKATQP